MLSKILPHFGKQTGGTLCGVRWLSNPYGSPNRKNLKNVWIIRCLMFLMTAAMVMIQNENRWLPLLTQVRSSCIVLNSLGIKTENNGILGNLLLYSRLKSCISLKKNIFLWFCFRVDWANALFSTDIKTIKWKSLSQAYFLLICSYFFFICFQLISTGLFTEQDFWDTSASKEVEEEVEWWSQIQLFIFLLLACLYLPFIRQYFGFPFFPFDVYIFPLSLSI